MVPRWPLGPHAGTGCCVDNRRAPHPRKLARPDEGPWPRGRDAGAALRALASTGRCAVYYDFVVRYCSATERTAVDEPCRARLTVSGLVPDAGLRPGVWISRPSELSGSMRDCRSSDAHPMTARRSPMEQSRRQSPDIPGGRGLTAGSTPPSKAPEPGGGKGMGWLLLAPIACCGGPLLIAAVAAARCGWRCRLGRGGSGTVCRPGGDDHDRLAATSSSGGLLRSRRERS